MALLAAGAIGGAGLATYAEAAHAQPTPAVSSAPIGMVTTPDFAQINKLYGPAVVNITVKGVEKVAADQDDPFQQFFGQFPGFLQNMPHQVRKVPMEGVGSGFIVSPDGIILTNAHVVKDAKSVVVKLTDRREYHAKVLGSDPQTDVAVIKIDATNLPTVKIGHVSSLQVGDWVLAIGSPYGLESTATAGIVSALGRSLPDDTSVPFIQTDVPVNPGNSGGPLFNAKGEVVGINSQIYTKTGGYQGLSFSIPIDVAQKIEQEILAHHGKVQHARLGVTAQEVNQDLANSFKLPSPSGALIASVVDGSAADHAGLKPGDVIRKIDGHDIISSGDLASVINMDAPGQHITMEVWRGGKPMTLTATLGKLNADDINSNSGSSASGHSLGLTLRALTPAEANAVGSQGLLVEQSEGAAADAGIQPDDVILSVNGVPATSVAQVRKEVAQSKGTVALLIQRGDNKIFVPVQLK